MALGEMEKGCVGQGAWGCWCQWTALGLRIEGEGRESGE